MTALSPVVALGSSTRSCRYNSTAASRSVWAQARRDQLPAIVLVICLNYMLSDNSRGAVTSDEHSVASEQRWPMTRRERSSSGLY
jgi:hypothetical protein